MHQKYIHANLWTYIITGEFVFFNAIPKYDHYEHYNLWIKRFEIQESNGTFLKHSTNSYSHNNQVISSVIRKFGNF